MSTNPKKINLVFLKQNEEENKYQPYIKSDFIDYVYAPRSLPVVNSKHPPMTTVITDQR